MLTHWSSRASTLILTLFGASANICPDIGQSSDRNSNRLKTGDPNGRFGFWETSGIALSITQTGPSGDPILFAINDKGGGSSFNRLGIFDSGSGQRLLTLRLPNKFPAGHDFESMTIGACGRDQPYRSCLYIGDIGDNRARSSNGSQSDRASNEPYRIFKIEEPIWGDFSDNDRIANSHYAEVFEFDYNHNSSPRQYSDSETLFYDTFSGDLYIVTKWDPGNHNLIRLFKIPAAAWDQDGTYSPVAYSGGNFLKSKTWTRGEMAPDGKLIALGDEERTYLFVRCHGISVEESLEKDYCRAWDNFLSAEARKHETVAFTREGDRTLQISECSTENKICNPPMIWTSLDFDNGDADPSCPELNYGSIGCFSGEGVVNVDGIGEVMMKDLVLGDRVLVQEGRYEPVYSFGHRQTDSYVEYLLISTSDKKLEITQDHMLFVEGRRSIPASMIGMGDKVETPMGTYDTVKSITTVTRRGAFAPFTASGTIVVNGITSSTFIAPQKSESLTIGGIDSGLTFQFLSHSFEIPHRVYCSYNMASCLEEQYTAEGISSWVEIPYSWFEWCFQDSAMWSTLLAFPFLLIICAIGSPISFVITSVALILIRRQIIQDKKF